ncbi:DUF4242 domain-containing protein [Tenacibaculum sp. 1_MG-2023]|uniref:DUF4242 domain-containing protein n=1 Tax=Tenacibaculum sp. 1_MG-2023 TaxID=3062653 RepID=UPI0026E23667|nr:DUF4242 domain-containing protein [Tenacibaculum sp. 1_MG-2023]MDO6676681.1 DUF4242 domain-containing protein [Tenacibaculum sp. 1_MG-2023]
MGKITPEELKEISQTSCDVLGKLGPKIQWVHSYVEDKRYCIYNTPNESKIREHAEKGRFPLNKTSTIYDSITMEQLK